MNWLRKVDWFLQIAVIIITLLMALRAGIFILLYAQIFLACVQIIGAGIYAFSQLPSIFRKAFRNYWLFVFAYFLILQILNAFDFQTSGDWFFILRFMIFPWSIACYYLYWYKKLINHFDYHRELEGLIKS